MPWTISEIRFAASRWEMHKLGVTIAHSELDGLMDGLRRIWEAGP